MTDESSKYLYLDNIDKAYEIGSRLGNSPIGHGDDKFLRQIIVSFDIKAPRYWWQEFDTYGYTTKNSQSTMHRILRFDIDSVCNQFADSIIINRFKVIVDEYNENPTRVNFARIKSNMPEGVTLTAGIVTNYAQLRTMYFQREHHKLEEWRVFCRFIEELPHAVSLGVCGKKEILGRGSN